MGRLTEKQSSGFDLKAMNGEWCNKYCEQQRVETCNECGIYQAIQKLAEYEDLDEQGLLLRLPCKVGDTVYIISRNNEIIPLNVHGIDIRKDDFTILAKNEKYCGYSILSLLGKYESVDWFLTQAEAEQKLKEMERD